MRVVLVTSLSQGLPCRCLPGLVDPPYRGAPGMLWFSVCQCDYELVGMSPPGRKWECRDVRVTTAPRGNADALCKLLALADECPC